MSMRARLYSTSVRWSKHIIRDLLDGAARTFQESSIVVARIWEAFLDGVEELPDQLLGVCTAFTEGIRRDL